jgi:hypothetical protein
MKTLVDDQCRAELIQRVRRLHPDSPRQWGRMTPHQMVCHLIDAFRMMTGEMAVSPSSSAMQRTLVKWVALYGPLRWPPGIPTRPEIDPIVVKRKPASFESDIQALVAMLTALERRPDGVWPAHPIFGPMSERAWFRWAYLHTDHHLRQFGA